ncbi:MAG: EamA family transporter, partial [Candidatus Aenigmarchaeota archaeon]|nr:EamA family transporter [Candidatus Aenigmarchaeota archaeon]
LLLFWILVFSQTLDALFVLSFNQVLSLLVSTGILFGYVYCWYYSIKLINVSKAAAILLLSPVISMILGIVIFKEPAPMNQLMGSIAILFGAYLISKVKSEFVEGM